MAKARIGMALAVQQFVEGFDFEPPARMIADLTPEQATNLPPASPYSIATVVAHMLFWQKQWLGRILDLPMERKKGKNGDFPIVSPEQWPTVRDEFIAGFELATAKASEVDDLQRRVLKGGTVEDRILRIVVHNSYHLGQVALLRQLIGSWPPSGGWDAW